MTLRKQLRHVGVQREACRQPGCEGSGGEPHGEDSVRPPIGEGNVPRGQPRGVAITRIQRTHDDGPRRAKYGALGGVCNRSAAAHSWSRAVDDGDGRARFSAMRICLVTPYDLSRHGGVNKHVLGLASALRRMGDEVEVIGPASDELTKPGPSPAARVTGFGGGVSIDGNGSENRLGIWTSPFQIWSYFRRHSFDVIHVHEPLLPLLPYYALWSADARVRFATFHCYTEHESRRSRWARQLMAPYLRAYNRGIAV